MNRMTTAIVSVLVGLVVGALGSTYAWLKFVETGDRNRTLASAQLQVQTLENLRGGELPTAFKTQERMLNTSIIEVGRLLQIDAADKEARVLLSRIKKYRKANPFSGRSSLETEDMQRALSLIE